MKKPVAPRGINHLVLNVRDIKERLRKLPREADAESATSRSNIERR